MGIKIRFGANISGKSVAVASLCYKSMKVYESKERAQCVS